MITFLCMLKNLEPLKYCHRFLEIDELTTLMPVGIEHLFAET